MNAKIDVTGLRIETPRLVLRPWREEDLIDLFAYSSIPGVGEMAGWPHHESISDSAKILEWFIREKKTLALELKETGRVIGSLGFEELNPDPVEGERLGRELGYVLDKNHWGRGLMPEAVTAAIEYCFHTLNYDYLTVSHFLWNGQSARVIGKCGFRFVKIIEYPTQRGTVETGKLYILENPHKEKENNV